MRAWCFLRRAWRAFWRAVLCASDRLRLVGAVSDFVFWSEIVGEKDYCQIAIKL